MRQNLECNLSNHLNMVFLVVLNQQVKMSCVGHRLRAFKGLIRLAWQNHNEKQEECY